MKTYILIISLLCFSSILSFGQLPRRYLELKEQDRVEAKSSSEGETLTSAVSGTFNMALDKMIFASMQLDQKVDGAKTKIENYKSRMTVSSKLIDLKTGHMTALSGNDMISFFINSNEEYIIHSDYSKINGKWVKSEELIFNMCVETAGEVQCFGAPPDGYILAMPISDQLIFGSKAGSTDKSVLFRKIDGQLVIKSNYDIQMPNLSNDGTKVYGYYYSTVKTKILFGVRVYDFETGKLISEIKTSKLGFPIILDDGRILIYYLNEQTDIYSKDGSKALITIKNTGFRLAVSQTSNHLISVSQDGFYKLFDLNTGRLIVEGQDTYIEATDAKKELSFGKQKVGAVTYIPGMDGYFLIPYSSGIMSLFSIKDLKVVANLFIDIDDWAIIAKDGRFDGSLNALEKLEWREYEEDNILSRTSLGSTFDGYFTPRLFTQILTGELSKQITETVTVKKIESLPTIVLSTIDDKSVTGSNISQYTTSKKNINVAFKVTENQDKVKEVKLYNNGKLVGLQLGNGGSDYKFNLSLNSVHGEVNAVYAVCSTELGIDSEKGKVIINYKGSDTSPSKLYALIIGINDYLNPKYKLNYALVDAKGVNQQIEKSKSGLFNEVEILTFYDKLANKANILQAFKGISSKMKEQDLFLFYFAGHGTMGINEGKEEFFIVPYDVTQLYGNESILNEKAISANELKIISSQMNAQKQIFILDACNSGGALNTAATRGAVEEKAVAQLARNTGSYWLTAASSEQYATEFEQLGHGVFTYSLLEAFGGKNQNLTSDGVLTIRELSSFVEQRVPELSEKYKGTPQFPASFSIGNDFPLLLYMK
jgi:WD40 repeat protein